MNGSEHLVFNKFKKVNQAAKNIGGWFSSVLGLILVTYTVASLLGFELDRPAWASEIADIEDEIVELKIETINAQIQQAELKIDNIDDSLFEVELLIKEYKDSGERVPEIVLKREQNLNKQKQEQIDKINGLITTRERYESKKE